MMFSSSISSSGDYAAVSSSSGHSETFYDQQSDAIDDDDYMQLPAVRLALIVSYVFVFVVGNVSNIAMLFVCIRQWREAARSSVFSSPSKTNYQNQISSAVTNAFVANLAIADILLCIFSLTSTPYSYYSHEWPFGDFLCRFTPSTLIFAVCVVSFTSTVMAVDRHIAVCYPHQVRLRLNIRSSLIAVALVWAASILACLPIFLSYRTLEESVEVEVTGSALIVNETEPITVSEYVNITKCDEHWPSIYRRAFSICILSIQFLLPAIIIAYCYIGIFVTLQNQRRFRQGNLKIQSSTSADVQRHSSLDRNRSNETNVTSSSVRSVGSNSPASQRRLWKATAILMSMVAIFMGCWMPINVLLLIADYHSETLTLWETTNWFSPAYFTSHLLAMTSTLWNPLLYGWLNERLRPEILKICCRSSPRLDKNPVIIENNDDKILNNGDGKNLMTAVINKETKEDLALMTANNQGQNGEANGHPVKAESVAFLKNGQARLLSSIGEQEESDRSGSERDFLKNNSKTDSSRKDSGNTEEEDLEKEYLIARVDFNNTNNNNKCGIITATERLVNNQANNMETSIISIDRFDHR